MMMMFFLMPAIIYIPAGIYFYFFFRRSVFCIHMENRVSKVLSVLFAVVCAAIGWQLYGIGGVIILHFLVCLLLMELIYRVTRKIRGKKELGKVMEFLYRSGVPAVLVILVVFSYGYYNMHQVKQTDYSLETDKQLDEPLQIAQISDLHMGTTMDVEKLKEYTTKIQEQSPDLLVLTGDIFDERTEKKMMEETVQVLSNVSSRYGTFYIWGNHDPNLYSAQQQYTSDELRETLEQSGIHVLEDESVQVTPQLAVIGRLDSTMTTQRKSISELLEGVDRNSYLVVLDHKPVELEENAAAGVDLQLSGHTHAGQIWPTGQLGELVGVTEKNYGLATIGDFRAIVSSGIAGWGYAIRTGGHSEYVMVEVL